jgi:hypothetical protein
MPGGKQVNVISPSRLLSSYTTSIREYHTAREDTNIHYKRYHAEILPRFQSLGTHCGSFRFRIPQTPGSGPCKFRGSRHLNLSLISEPRTPDCRVRDDTHSTAGAALPDKDNMGSPVSEGVHFREPTPVLGRASE